MNVPLLTAPMAELSHRALRELIEDFGGCDEYFTEMISAGALLAGGPFEKWYIDPGPRPEKLIFQLVGSDSEQISRAAAVLDRLECAGIDINMGCSAPLIRKTGAGAAWMASIDRAGALISQVRPAVKRRLSVKLRIGMKDDFEYLVDFCRRLEAEGVDLIILHPRTAAEKFKRLARWEYVGRLKQELKIPVAGNGDIASAEELAYKASGQKESRKTSHGGHREIEPKVREGAEGRFCDAVMVGRAAVRQPWIFAEAKRILAANHTNQHEQNGRILPRSYTEGNTELHRGRMREREERENEKAETANIEVNGFVPNLEETGLRFLELLARYQPPEFHISRARRFFGFFCDNLKWGTYLKNQLNREESLSGVERAWRGFFAEEGSEL